jgi:hypothetical protein
MKRVKKGSIPGKKKKKKKFFQIWRKNIWPRTRILGTPFSTFFKNFRFFSIKSEHFFRLFSGPRNLSILWRFIDFFLGRVFFTINVDFIDFLETGVRKKRSILAVLGLFWGKKWCFLYMRFFRIFGPFLTKIGKLSLFYGGTLVKISKSGCFWVRAEKPDFIVGGRNCQIPGSGPNLGVPNLGVKRVIFICLWGFRPFLTGPCFGGSFGGPFWGRIFPENW